MSIISSKPRSQSWLLYGLIFVAVRSGYLTSWSPECSQRLVVASNGVPPTKLQLLTRKTESKWKGQIDIDTKFIQVPHVLGRGRITHGGQSYGSIPIGDISSGIVGKHLRILKTSTEYWR